MNNILEIAHSIMSSGNIPECNFNIPKGKCSCCTVFDTDWIGLLLGEDDVLFQQGKNTSNWAVKDNVTSDPDIKGLVCNRLCVSQENGIDHYCDNKPLDCLFYPFYPISFYRLEDKQAWDISFGAKFPKCPLSVSIKRYENACSYEDLIQGNGVEKHLARCSLTSLFLHKNLDYAASAFGTLFKSFVNYDATYIVRVTDMDFGTLDIGGGNLG